ncbi:aromatic ring-hydroxylating dioxygenase subunit alpha [Herbiconiux sp. VKM Ac-1786]|uniref:aromatic ring-hydroxylating dioxygenase subunit alpha n=1 Tax=Herbiconiux sp. VKM Ac-1786 TaxID=2783824 RepID=UPI00188C73C0|nr:aromatic ring-hydroxylating dioxygenase subunit alpha [Herbiconiux sp. VKM Ac-1786]MBF4571858.1 aromatic ring-hydroxylating dioxygenase subunit alpha [Herbiconiux sp. VKM Ac-1786]
MTIVESTSSTTNKTLRFPLNAWYVAAWDREVVRKPLAVRVANQPLALYRTEDGEVVALADACWHRLAPLSMGKVVGKDGIQCPYHGIVYNSAGRCVSMPAQEVLNPSATVPSFPAVERYRFIWVWLGDPLLADPDKIPDMHQMDDPKWAGDGETIDLDCNYQLVLDNLMDLTHEEFIHTSSIGGKNISSSDFIVTHGANSVTLSRWMIDIEPVPFMRGQMNAKFPGFEGNVDRWQIIRYEFPSTICIDVGVAKTGTGAPEGDRSQGINGYVMNTISPSTDTTSRYFWAWMRNYLLDSQKLTTQIKDGIAGVFREDTAMLNAQQVAIDAMPSYEFYNLNIDAGGMWIRRLIERALEAEGAPWQPRT